MSGNTFKTGIRGMKMLARAIALALPAMVAAGSAFAEDAKGYRDNNHNERQGVHLAGIYRLTRKNQFRFEGEFDSLFITTKVVTGIKTCKPQELVG